METAATILAILRALLASNCCLLVWGLQWQGPLAAAVYLVAAVILLIMVIHPGTGKNNGRRLGILSGGRRLLTAYLAASPVTLALCIWATVYMAPVPELLGTLIAQWLVGLLATGLLLLFGGLRVLGTSTQMRPAARLALLGLWWAPVAGYVLAWNACTVAGGELRLEKARLALDKARAGDTICATRYPILLVHGVFFRDSSLLCYWGRIPAALIRNGARVYYGQQQSAASVADSAAELKTRIEEILRETGSEKVNIIAHSKGGLDARWAISCLGAAPMVASLTTINTPHRGCIFAQWLLEHTPDTFQQRLAAFYETALRRLGDRNPNFLAAVQDLTASACEEINRQAPDVPGVLYESVGSYVRRAQGGRFPLNLSHRLVKHFDGVNDGLVSVESARWGSRFTLLEPKGRRGISHADVIDLGRENVPGFDVQEFYVNLVADLRRRGY